MPAAVPGNGSSNKQLESRIATLERLLMRYSKMRVEVFDLNIQSPIGVEILASRGGGGKSGGEGHQWKVTKADKTKLNVKGGNVSTQGQYNPPYVVGEVKKLEAPSNGYVILKIDRDSKSREITLGKISYQTGEVGASDYSSQIIPLAQVIFEKESISKIIPLKFEEIHIFEELVVVNGQFRFADLMMAGRNIYELPPI